MNKRGSRIFYGWWIVGASFFIAFYVGGVVFYGFTAVFEPIAGELGWSYTQISLAASLRGLEMGLLAPLVGVLTDRWGPRRLIFGASLIATLGLILLSKSTSLGMFYGAFVLVAIGMSGSTMTVLMAAVANWFRKRVSIASGIAICGFGFGGLLVPVIVGLIETYGWRVSVVMLAAGMLLVLLPLSLLFRHKPQQYGLLTDGQPGSEVTSGTKQDPLEVFEVDVRVKQAVRSGTFWRIALAYTCHVILVTAVVTHVMPYLSSINISRSKSSLIATAIPIASIAGRLGLGWLGDRFNKRVVTAVSFTVMGFGLVCFGYAASTGTWVLVPFLILFGIGYGGANAMRLPLVQKYFGMSNFGAVFGLIIGLNMAGSMLGPALAGWVYDSWGSYQSIWFIFAGLPVAAALSILTIVPVKISSKTEV